MKNINNINSTAGFKLRYKYSKYLEEVLAEKSNLKINCEDGDNYYSVLIPMKLVQLLLNLST